MRLKGLVALLAAGAVIVGSGTASRADVEPALGSGDTVTFLVPQGTEIIAGPQGDVVHFVGQPTGTTQVAGCVEDTDLPIQRVVLVDPGSGIPAQHIDVIVASPTTGVPPGTRLEDLVMGNPCGANGTNYDRYSGTVR